MKLIIASDIHGSKFYLEKLLKRFEIEKADKLVLLGDIYYHGPRNPFPEEYNPMGVSELLNNIKDKLVVIHGNCDSEVDQMISEFTFTKNEIMDIDGKKLFLTHGHIYNIDNFPQEDFDILAYGHFHVNFIKTKEGKVIINPGSLSLPKEDTKPGYITIEAGVIKQHLLDGSVIDELKL